MIAFTPEDAAAAAALDIPHRDPFDRGLVAQSLRRKLTLVSADDAIRTFGRAEVVR